MPSMQIVHEQPPMLDAIYRAGLKPNPLTTVFTYGYTLFNPAGATISANLLAHEEVHARQQEETVGGPDAWWEFYLENSDFRIQEEVEAYRAQYQHYCRQTKNIAKRARFLAYIADDLSGALYGNRMSFDQAAETIRSTK